MRDVYLRDEDYNRLVGFLVDNVLGSLLGEVCRDALMIGLGEKAGIWPESSRPEEVASISA